MNATSLSRSAERVLRLSTLAGVLVFVLGATPHAPADPHDDEIVEILGVDCSAHRVYFALHRVCALCVTHTTTAIELHWIDVPMGREHQRDRAWEREPNIQRVADEPRRRNGESTRGWAARIRMFQSKLVSLRPGPTMMGVPYTGLMWADTTGPDPFSHRFMTRIGFQGVGGEWYPDSILTDDITSIVPIAYYSLDCPNCANTHLVVLTSHAIAGPAKNDLYESQRVYLTPAWLHEGVEE